MTKQIITKPTNPNKLTLGEKIRFFRARAEMSQLVLETEAELGQGMICRIEKNSVAPLNGTIHKISDVLNLDAKETAYLMGVNLYSHGNKQILHTY